MLLKKILFPTLLGTTAMTAFSYLVSKKKKRNFKEPKVLAQMFERLPGGPDDDDGATAAGFGAHYLAGLLFAVPYVYLWEKEILQPDLPTGAALGAASGLAGIAGWELMFKLHPSPPPKNKKRYFGHLMLAHIVFGVFSAAGYRMAIRSN